MKDLDKVTQAAAELLSLKPSKKKESPDKLIDAHVLCFFLFQ
jgi:hypothetical protein